MQVIGIIGGSQKKSYNQLNKNRECKVIFHNGKGNGSKNKKTFKRILKSVDCIVVMVGAVSHESMWIIKDLAKQLNKPITYHRGFGLSGAIKKGTELVA